ncbi:diguanylate cyclase domain-containing protein (plasmid) [Pseudoalteromonas espejiana]
MNDTYGHAVGDKVLIEVAALLRVILAKGYVFRVGGEEFALFHSFQHKTKYSYGRNH